MERLLNLWWAPVLAAAALVASGDTHGDVGDVIYFAHAGESLLGAGWADVFADPELQSGPIQLALLGVLARLADLFGVPLGTVLAYAIEVGGALALVLVLRRVVGRRRGDGWKVVLLGAGLAAVALGLPQAAYVDGHPAQLFAPLLWVLAGLATRKGQVARAGILVGLSAGFELWGVLGVCVLAGAPSIRATARGAAFAAAVAVGLLAPFALLGEFAMFEFEWNVASGTLVSLFVDPGTPYPWGARFVQAATAVLAGGAVAWALRGKPSAIWSASLAAVLVRLAFDPVFYAAYLVAPLTLAVVGAVEFVAGDLFGAARAARSDRRSSGQGAAAIRR